MLKEHDAALRQFLIAADLAILTCAFFIAYFLRTQIGFIQARDIQHIYPIQVYLATIPLVLGVWMFSLFSLHAYRPFRGRDYYGLTLEIAKACLLSVIIFASIAFLLKLHYLSRIFMALIFSIGGLFLWATRCILLYSLRHLRQKGYNYRQILIVGTGPRAQGFIDLVRRHSELGLKILGFVDEDAGIVGAEILGYKVLGTISDIPKILEKEIVDEVVFIVPRSWLNHKEIENAVLYCEELGKRVSMAIDLFSMKFAKVRQSGFHDFPLLVFQSTPDKLWSLLVKRLLDIFLSLAALIVLSPVFALAAVIVKSSSQGPALFRQKRCTLNGRVFTMYKFRTMIQNAEQMMDSLRQKNEMKGPAFKMTHDPRTTRVGRWMRKTSLDEFPQFWNVLKGDMSIVGPRPPIPSEVANYEPWQRRRLSMRPGLTCLWQIKGRNKIVDFDEWMRLDLQYIDQWSLSLDLKIFLQTIPVVLFARGAK